MGKATAVTIQVSENVVAYAAAIAQSAGRPLDQDGLVTMLTFVVETFVAIQQEAALDGLRAEEEPNV